MQIVYARDSLSHEEDTVCSQSKEIVKKVLNYFQLWKSVFFRYRLSQQDIGSHRFARSWCCTLVEYYVGVGSSKWALMHTPR